MLREVLIVSATALLLVIQGQRPPPGGYHPLSPDDPALQPAIVFAAANINADSQSKYCQTVVNVTNAAVKEADGTLFKFLLSLQESDQCIKEECMGSVPANKCLPNPHSKPYWCDVDLMIKTWATPSYLFRNLTCHNPSTY